MYIDVDQCIDKLRSQLKDLQEQLRDVDLADARQKLTPDNLRLLGLAVSTAVLEPFMAALQEKAVSGKPITIYEAKTFQHYADLYNSLCAGD